MINSLELPEVQDFLQKTLVNMYLRNTRVLIGNVLYGKRVIILMLVHRKLA